MMNVMYVMVMVLLVLLLQLMYFITVQQIYMASSFRLMG